MSLWISTWMLPWGLSGQQSQKFRCFLTNNNFSCFITIHNCSWCVTSNYLRSGLQQKPQVLIFPHFQSSFLAGFALCLTHPAVTASPPLPKSAFCASCPCQGRIWSWKCWDFIPKQKIRRGSAKQTSWPNNRSVPHSHILFGNSMTASLPRGTT